MIRHAERQNLFAGLHFSSPCPHISYLFFTNDSVLLGKEDAQNVEAIKTILQEHAAILGQEVNFQKCSLHFDKTVPSFFQDSIAAILESTTGTIQELILVCLILLFAQKNRYFNSLRTEFGKNSICGRKKCSPRQVKKFSLRILFTSFLHMLRLAFSFLLILIIPLIL